MTEGLSREELRARLSAIVKWLEENQPDVYERGIWDAIGPAASSLKQAEQVESRSQLRRIAAMKGEPAPTFEGKQAEPPSQPAMSAEKYWPIWCMEKANPALFNLGTSSLDQAIAFAENYAKYVAESPSQARTQPPNRNDWEGKVLAFAREYGEPWSIRAAMENWKERYLKAEYISQATKEEWARRIAEEECSGNFVDLTEDEVKSRVLALMTNEGEKI